jgi:hypothetical protein
LTRPPARPPAVDLDADELEAELADLEAEELDNQLLEPAPVPATRAPAAAAAEPALPSVPQRAAAAKKVRRPRGGGSRCGQRRARTQRCATARSRACVRACVHLSTCLCACCAACPQKTPEELELEALQAEMAL